MIPLNDTLEKVERSGFGEQKAFTIEADAFMFQNLSKNLYSAPVAAVVREYGTNALDANPKVPFKYHVPNKLEPWFSVRDFGPGLSETEVFTVFNSYGKSTKKDSNESVGFFGLGAKSAFAISKNWSVRSFQNGWVKTYDCYYGEDGKPKITIVAGMETTEPDGVEVRVPVKQEYFRTFERDIVHIYSHFNPQPEGGCILEKGGIEGIRGTVLAKGSNWVVHTTGYYGNGWTIKQGPVVYPIDQKLDAFKDHVLGSYSVMLEVPIGSVSLAPSREHLHYDKQTLVFLVNALSRVASKSSDSVHTEYNKLPTDYERNIFLRDLYDKDYKWYRLCAKVKKFTRVDGTDEISPLDPVIKKGYLEACEKYKILDGGGVYKIRTNKNHDDRAEIKNHLVVVLDSKVTHHLQRLKVTMKDKGFSYALLIDDSKGVTKDILYCLYNPPGVLYTSKGDLLEVPKVEKVSDGGPSTSKNSALYRGYIFHKNSLYIGRLGRTHWEPKEIDIRLGGTYVFLKDRTAESYSDTFISDRIKEAGLLLQNTQELVGISSVSKDRFLKNKEGIPGVKWISLEELLKKATEETITKVISSTGLTREEILECFKGLLADESRYDKFVMDVYPLLDKTNSSNLYKTLNLRYTLLQRKDAILDSLGSDRYNKWKALLNILNIYEGESHASRISGYPLFEEIQDDLYLRFKDRIKEFANIVNLCYRD